MTWYNDSLLFILKGEVLFLHVTMTYFLILLYIQIYFSKHIYESFEMHVMQSK